MIQHLLRLLTGRSLLILVVDTNDAQAIKRHIELLEHIQSGVQPVRKQPFAAFIKREESSPPF